MIFGVPGISFGVEFTFKGVYGREFIAVETIVEFSWVFVRIEDAPLVFNVEDDLLLITVLFVAPAVPLPVVIDD